MELGCLPIQRAWCTDPPDRPPWAFQTRKRLLDLGLLVERYFFCSKMSHKHCIAVLRGVFWPQRCRELGTAVIFPRTLTLRHNSTWSMHRMICSRYHLWVFERMHFLARCHVGHSSTAEIRPQTCEGQQILVRAPVWTAAFRASLRKNLSNSFLSEKEPQQRQTLRNNLQSCLS